MRRTYRVAMVAACPFPTSQGSQVLIRQLAEALAARGHAVHLVTYHLGEATARLPPGVQLHRIPDVPRYRKTSSGPAWGKLWLDILLVWALWRVVRREAIDVIHAHNYEALLVSWIVGRLTGKPVVYHSHNVMAAELPTYFRLAWARRLAAWLAWALDHGLPRAADMCIALSPEAVAFYRACGVREERLRLIPPGIDFDHAEALDPRLIRERYQLGDDPLVMYTGNLDQYQRLGALLRSFRQVHGARPEAQLVVVSHSPLACYHALLAEAGPCSGVHFIHSHTFAETRALLMAADLAICPRVACFGFPIKLLNYMAAGKAIVVAQGSAKGIRHLENGYVVADDEDALAAGVLHVLQSPALAARLGRAARASIERRFQWAHVVNEIERCYDSLTLPVTEPVVAEGRVG